MQSRANIIQDYIKAQDEHTHMSIMYENHIKLTSLTSMYQISIMYIMQKFDLNCAHVLIR